MKREIAARYAEVNPAPLAACATLLFAVAATVAGCHKAADETTQTSAAVPVEVADAHIGRSASIERRRHSHAAERCRP